MFFDGKNMQLSYNRSKKKEGRIRNEMKRTNKEVVEYFYERVFNAGDLSELDDLMWDDYKQHSPEVADGKEGFIEFFKGFLQGHPKTTTIKCLEDGDMVCMFFKCEMDGGVVVKVFDLYRLRDGKLAEHWDCTMRVDDMECNNPNGQF